MSVSFWGFKSTTRSMEITISQETFTKGAWFTASVIVHEMAHLAGVPGIDGSDPMQQKKH
jgi:peptide deformylase